MAARGNEASVRHVTTGWADVLGEIKRQTDSGASDLKGLWSLFENLAEASPRADVLAVLRKAAADLPLNKRAQLAIVIAALLEPVEWPSAWARARGPTITALDSLLQETDPRQTGSLPAALELSQDVLCMTNYAMLQVARQLLSEPCPKNELKYAAGLCTGATAGLFFALNQKLQELPAEAQTDTLREARARFEAAFRKYAIAALTLNKACGSVMFSGLDARLEGA